MARYAVEHIWEGKQEYFLIRDHQSWQMVLFPSKYLTHLIRANRSPNTVGRRAKSIRFYLEYLDEKKMELSQVAELEFQEQYEHYVGFLHWLKVGNHLHEKKEKLPSNKTCNAYLKDVFRFFCFLELEADMERLKVLYYDSFTTHDSIGVKRKLRFRSFNGYLKEEERNVRPAEHQEILELLKQCTNCRDQLLIMLLAETGYRIGEILGVNYTRDIDYERHTIRVFFRDDNENKARAKNAAYRRSKVSDATFQFLLFYLSKYREFLQHQPMLFVNIEGETKGKALQVDGKEKTVPSSLITYVRKAYQFTEAEEERDEIEKDIWTLENLDIAYKKNPIKNVQTLNFTTIIQDDLREETKKAVYEHLHHEAIATIIKELTAIRRLSKYLKETYPHIHSAEELNRELLEEYLTYLATEAEGVNNYRMDLTRLRGVLETIGKLYGYPHLEILFLASDLPRQVQPKLKSYSDSELIRFNAALAELDEQMERLMVIHQMLGTRISDTLTLQTDCLYRQDGHPMIQIRQMKTTTFVKPISAELELLIEKAIQYTRKMYGDTVYIFVDEKNSKRPMQYNTVQNKVMDLIQKKDLRDDHGELFGFGTHMFRHVYGIRLTELHLDDWTIAKLLGHTSVKNVKFYRKMSLQIIADETREIRAEMSRMIRANLAGWGKEYEQI